MSTLPGSDFADSSLGREPEEHGGGARRGEENAEALAIGWIEAWIRMDMDWLRQRLSPDFVHISPFGTLEGREHYLETVEPMARKSVMELTIRQVIASGDRAAIWFENRTPEGVVPSCDWLLVEEGTIREIRSFYDTVKIRGVLSPSEQTGLEGEDGSS